VAQSFYPLTPVDVSPAITGSWQDVACAAYIPAGATGVLLHIVNEDTANHRTYSLRKKGSTDDRVQSTARKDAHHYGAIGVDANREFQAYIETTDVKIYLIAYTQSGVTFFTNAHDKSLTTTQAWTTIDCSTQAPNAVGLIFELYSVADLFQDIGLRKKGSTDNRVHNTRHHNWVILGCNETQQIEGYVESTDHHFYLVGYVTDGAAFKTNAPDKGPTVADVYQDIDCSVEAPEAVMLFFEIAVVSSPHKYALRKDNTRPDIFRDCVYHGWAMVECDSSQIYQGKIDQTNIDFFLLGYATGAPPGPTIETQDATDIQFDQATLHTKVTDDQGKTLTVRHTYAKTTAYGVNTPWQEGKHTDDVISQTVTELEPDTLYHFRGEATYEDGTPGTVYGADNQFTTLPGPTIQTQDATGIKSDQATLATKVLDDKGKTLSVRHNYGETTEYGKNTPWQEGKHTNDVISQTVTELEPETEYHFRGEAIYED